MRRTINYILLIAAVSFLWSCCDECPSETRQKIESEAAEKLDAFNSQIAKLAALAAEAGQDAREELSEAIDELETMFQQAKVQLQELKEAGADQWENASSAVSSALESLDKRLAEISAKFGK